MKASDTDTIIAPATPPGRSALALIRLSGPQARAWTENLAPDSPALIARRACVRTLKKDHQILDEVVVTFWPAPRSFTGEDIVEISCHGNFLIVQALLNAFQQLGARLAQPGEFTRRAFLNGRMDLTQAEAVAELIHAESERALQAARALQQGHLGRLLNQARNDLIEVMAHLEAYLDFPEEDIQPDTGENLVRRVQTVNHILTKLLSTAREGRLLRHGARVVLAGAPNAGKSSLLNALLQADRAIVSPVPGTTRDTIEESILIEDVPVRLMDTAGLRQDADEIEALGIARTRQAMKEADLILACLDGTRPDGGWLEEWHRHNPVPLLRVVTKADLPRLCHPSHPHHPVSAKTGDGLPELQRAMARALQLEPTGEADRLIINLRHQGLLQEARQALERALQGLLTELEIDRVAADLRLAATALGDVVGEISHEDILDRLFQTFCIGK